MAGMKTSEARRQAAKLQRRTDPLRSQLYQAKARAAKRGVPFELTKADLYLPVFCPVLGLRLVYETQDGQGCKLPARATLDCLLSHKGYVKGNVRVISWRANRLKADATAEELRAILKYVEEH